ncbi:MAG: alpha/beta hydrolase [Bryobacterales bacterium]|nr:alpha/beta hydrolase [Bryobacterales bacterium]
MPQEYPIILRGFPGTVTRVDDVVCGSANSKALLADLYLPVEAARPLAVIMYLHDDEEGGRKSGPDLRRFFAQRGFAMVSVDCSSANVGDVRQTIAWVRGAAAEYGFDPARIGLWGLGTGGRLALAAALAPENDVKVVVAAYPESDGADAAKQSGAPPILLVHGLADAVRPAAGTELLFDALGVAGNEVTMCLVERLGHRFMSRNNFDQGDFPRVKKYECRGGEPPIISEAPPFTFGTVETFFRRWL